MQTTLLLLVAAFLGARALDTGAPYDACVSMTPQHGTNKPQTSPSPYEIQITPLEDGQYGGACYFHSLTLDGASQVCTNLIFTPLTRQFIPLPLYIAPAISREGNDHTKKKGVIFNDM